MNASLKTVLATKITSMLFFTVKDLEQRISRLERVVLKMRNTWVHHRTGHLKGLEFDDKQEK